MGTHTHITKNIAIMDRAYAVLQNLKLPGESFSEIILRLGAPKRKPSLLDFAGTITWEEGEEMQRRIKEGRKRWSNHTRQKLGIP
ncbi:antitoxin VapB family protein [Candidatus Woesearchaeota archaeon]|nr:antitoxin VapB family protein [Candidatus Woesearchaeota archaeon]